MPRASTANCQKKETEGKGTYFTHLTSHPRESGDDYKNERGDGDLK
jgi:hypothetical protein